MFSDCVYMYFVFHKVILYCNSYVPLDISPVNRARCPAFKTSSNVTAQRTVTTEVTKLLRMPDVQILLNVWQRPALVGCHWKSTLKLHLKFDTLYSFNVVIINAFSHRIMIKSDTWVKPLHSNMIIMHFKPFIRSSIIQKKNHQIRYRLNCSQYYFFSLFQEPRLSRWL